MSEAEYLSLEANADERHEYVGGGIRAMAGASLLHNEVCLGLASMLRARAVGTGCRVFMENARLRVSAQRYYYPDVMVTCAPQTDSHQVMEPCIVVEVVSPTTAQIDRGEKRMAYLQIPSLRHFLLVDHEAGVVEHLSHVDEHSPWIFAQADVTMTLQVDCPAPTVIDVSSILGSFD